MTNLLKVDFLTMLFSLKFFNTGNIYPPADLAECLVSRGIENAAGNSLPLQAE